MWDILRDTLVSTNITDLSLCILQKTDFNISIAGILLLLLSAAPPAAIIFLSLSSQRLM